MNEKKLQKVDDREADRIARLVTQWFNAYPDKILPIAYQVLPSDQPAMALSTIQGAFKKTPFLRGAYIGTMAFKIVYRFQPGNSSNSRLAADEYLDALADWAIKKTGDELPNIGKGKAYKFVCDARAALYWPYEDGSEDHQVLMTMEYYWPG